MYCIQSLCQRCAEAATRYNVLCLLCFIVFIVFSDFFVLCFPMRLIEVLCCDLFLLLRCSLVICVSPPAGAVSPQSCRAFPSRHSSVAPRPAGREEQDADGKEGKLAFPRFYKKGELTFSFRSAKRERIIDRKPIVEMTLSTKC